MSETESGIDRAVRDFFREEPTPVLSRAEALEAVRACLDAERSVATARVFLSDRVVWRGALRDLAGARVEFPDGEAYGQCWVALVDPSPETLWAHPAFFAFIPGGGQAPAILRATELPPHSTGDVLLEAGPDYARES